MEGFMALLLLPGTAQGACKAYTLLLQNKPGLHEFEGRGICLLQTELTRCFTWDGSCWAL